MNTWHEIETMLRAQEIQIFKISESFKTSALQHDI